MFVLLHLAPGDPVLAVAPPAAPPATIEALREQLGLNRPLWVQYVEYLKGVVTLDLGESLVNRGVPVTQRIGETFPATLELTLSAMIVAVGVGVTLGAAAGARRGGALDVASRFFGILIYSAPIFWLGIIAILLFAQPYVKEQAILRWWWRGALAGVVALLLAWLALAAYRALGARRSWPLAGTIDERPRWHAWAPWGAAFAVAVAAAAIPAIGAEVLERAWPQLPTGGRGMTPHWQWGADEGLVADKTGMNSVDSLLAADWEAFTDNVEHLALPATTLGLVIGGIFLRITRVNMLQTMRSDYVDAARARGVAEPGVVWRHAFKNALIPVVTVVGLTFALLLGGAVLTENVFNWPGIARELTRALGQRDYPLVQGITAFFAVIVIGVSIAIDLVNAWIDPRIRY